MNKGSKFLSVMVVGNNPEKLMEKYDKSLKVEPYVKFKYLEAETMKKRLTSYLSEFIKNHEKFALNQFQVDYFKERLKAVNSMSTFEYYSTITQGMYYNEDGDAMTDVNPNGKWDKYNLGKNFSYPLKLKDGKEVYQAKAGDVDWDKMHMNHEYVELFKKIWSLVIDDAEPSSKEEENLKVNWSSKKNYLSNFKSVDDFVSHNCAYWNYAFLSDKGWIDVDDELNETKWISEFVERFIVPLKDDDLITIYEYSVHE
jgi:hypothetical protein